MNKWFSNAWYYVFEWPLRTLYMNGPALYEYGFWEGKDKRKICAQLIPDMDWEDEPTLADRMCTRAIERKFQAFETGVFIVIYVYVWWKLSWFVVGWCWRRRRRNTCPDCPRPHLPLHYPTTVPDVPQASPVSIPQTTLHS